MNPIDKSADRIGRTRQNLDTNDDNIRRDEFGNIPIKKLRHSPQHNTEGKDYNIKDIYAKEERVEHDSHIIADAFKPTLNKWVDEDKNISHEKEN